MTDPECISCAGNTEEVNRTGILDACEREHGVPCTLCQEHTELDAELAIANSTVKQLLERRQRVRAKINQQHDVLTTTIPEEIVSRIFEFVLANGSSGRVHDKKEYEDSHSWAIPTDKGVSPLLLGSICRSWRRIAWSTPSLWSVVRIYSSIERIPSQTQVEILCDWLKRSGQTPLSIRLLGSSASDGNTFNWQTIDINGVVQRAALEQLSKVNRQLINLINQESERWEQVVIEGPQLSCANLLGSSTQSAHRIRELTVKDVNLALTHKPLFEDMPEKPRPESVTIIHSNIEAIDIQWNHVSNLFMKGSDSEFFAILRLAPQLSHCIWELSRARAGYTWFEQAALFSSPARNPIRHSMQSLEICSPLPNMEAIFDNLTIPHLSHYKVTHTHRNFPWKKFLEQIRRSSCPLISLAICHTGRIPYDDLINILAEATSLRKLHLTSDPFVPETIQALLRLLSDTSFNDPGTSSTSADQRQFLPRLESFEYEKVTDRAHSSDNVFWEHVPGIFGSLSRIGHPQSRPLKRLKISWRVSPPPLDENGIPKPEVPLTKEKMESLKRKLLIPKVPLVRLLKLSEAGVVLDFRDSSLKGDLLKLSMKGHRIRLRQKVSSVEVSEIIISGTEEILTCYAH